MRRGRNTAVMIAALVAFGVLSSRFASTQSLDDMRSAARVRAHMEFLADDLLEGRGAGTRGYDLAAKYVSSVLQTSGFEPGAAGTFLQPVPLRRSRRTAAALTLTPKDGPPVSLTLPADAIVFGDHLRANSEVTAPLVYAGFGVTAPELKYDDYAGLDARGKIVLALTNAPSQFASELRAHHASFEEKLSNAARHGAVGIVFAALPEEQKRYPWQLIVGFAERSVMAWIDARGQPANQFEALRGSALLSPSGTMKLFAYSPTPLEQVYAAGEKGSPKSFEFPLTATLKTVTEHTPAVSANVVGVLRGDDPALANSYVLLTAHLDHEGIGPPVNGDAIYNGAYDNAAGCAVLLEVARAIAQAQPRPRRSVLVVFVTAEESGLIGSDYFAHNPTVPRASIVANVNVDMPVLQWPLADVVAFGAENSSLGAVAERAVAKAGLKLAPDPMPEENLFVRSDQYSLVKQGVPAISLVPGFTSKDPSKKGAEIFGSFMATHYHRPSDDLSLPIDLGAVAAFTRANYLITMAIANDPVAPTWKPGNFFGERFGRR